jgi:hypothetical protein
VGSIAAAAREHGRLKAQEEQAAAERYYTGDRSSDSDEEGNSRGGSGNVSKPPKHYPPESEF